MNFRVCGAAMFSLTVWLFSLEDDADMVDGVIGDGCGRQLLLVILEYDMNLCDKERVAVFSLLYKSNISIFFAECEAISFKKKNNVIWIHTS